MWTQTLGGFIKRKRALVPSSSFRLKFRFRSQHLKPFFFLIYVSRGKSEGKLVEHLLSLCWGENMLLLRWANTANIGAFTTQTQAGFKASRLAAQGAPLRGGEGAATWAQEVCFGSRAWNL